MGKPQVFPGLQYPGLQDEALHPVERGELREHCGCVLGAEMPGQVGDRIGWDRVGWDGMNEMERHGVQVCLDLRGVCTVQRRALDAAAVVSRAGGCGRLLARAWLRSKG